MGIVLQEFRSEYLALRLRQLADHSLQKQAHLEPTVDPKFDARRAAVRQPHVREHPTITQNLRVLK